MHHSASPSFPFPPSEPSAPSSVPHPISPQGCLHPSAAPSVVCRVYSSGTILSCRVERVVSTPDRTRPDALSSNTQRFDASQEKRAYDPRPAATGEALRHERAARRGLPHRGATSANGYTPGSLRPLTPCAEARHEPQPSLYKPFTGPATISTSAVRPSKSPPLPASSASAHQPSMSTVAAVRSPLFHRPDPTFDMRESSGITLPPIRTSHSSRPSLELLELPSMKAILAASSHFFSADRHHHHNQYSSTEQSTSLSSTLRSQTTYSPSTTTRFEKGAAAHHPSMSGPHRATLAAPARSQLHCRPARALLSVRLPEVDLTATESPRFEPLIGARQGSKSNNLWRQQPIHASLGGESLDSHFDAGSARSAARVNSDLRAREEGASSALLSLSALRHAGHGRHDSPSLELSSPSQPGSLHVSSSDVSHHSPFLPASSSRAPASPYDHPVLPLPPSSYAGPSRHYHDRHHRNVRSIVDPYPSPYSHVTGRRTVSPLNSLKSGAGGPGAGKGAGETAGGKKRRARATPEQLEILNQVYARTPFPSTQERIDLATTLGMTPRSVQIWFQNRRQGAKHSENKRREQPALVSSSTSTTNLSTPLSSPGYGSPGSQSQHSEPGVALRAVGPYTHGGSNSPVLECSTPSSSRHSASRSPVHELRTRGRGRRVSVDELLRKDNEDSSGEDSGTPEGAVRRRYRDWGEDEEWRPSARRA